MWVVVGIVASLTGGEARGAEWSFAWGHPSPQGNALHAVSFADDQHGYAVGSFGAVLRTEDAGDTWTLTRDPRTADGHLYDVLAVAPDKLVAAGEGIAYSLDGGDTLRNAHPPVAGPFFDLARRPGGGVSAAGRQGRVVVTVDGGRTWRSIGPGGGVDIRRHAWSTPRDLWVVGDGVASHTDDFGATWTEFLTPPQFGFNDVFFTDARQGWVMDDFGWGWTTDGGATWTYEPVFVSPVYRFRTLPIDGQHWLLTTFLEGAEIWETFDAGQTWDLWEMTDALGYPGLARTPTGRVVVTSSSGEIRTTDDGVHFVSATEHLAQAITAPILAIHDRGDGVLFAANQPSQAQDVQAWLRSDDGGDTWFVPPASPGLRWAFRGWFSPTVGVVADGETIRHTTNGGDSWLASTSLPAGNRVTDFAELNGELFLTAARAGGGGLFHSTDGGASWSPWGAGLSPALRPIRVRFVGGVGLITGDIAGTGSLWRSLDGGVSWVQIPFGLGQPAADLWWESPAVGVAAYGPAGPATGLARTVDGGATWTPTTPARVGTLAMGADGTGFALGRIPGDAMLFTQDGGRSWEPLEVPFAEPYDLFPSIVTAALPVPGGGVFGTSQNRLIVGTVD